MDLVLALFLLSVLVFLRPGKDRIDYLSKDNTLPLRGIMAFAIIFHHISEKADSGFFFPLMQHFGYLIVAVFLFLSGYGLICSYNKKGKEYLKGFLKKRVLYLLIVYCLVTVIYAIYHLILGDFSFSLTIAENSWYMWVQIVLYLIFWLSFSLFDKRTAILSVFILQTLMNILLIIVGFGVLWYISNYAFVFGIVFGNYKDGIDLFIKKHYIPFTCSAIVLFFIFSYLPSVVGIYSICRIISTVFFCIIVISFILAFKITGKLWAWIGKMSLEIYLLHGLVYMSLRHFISNDVIWLVLTIIITVAISYFASKLNNLIRKLLS